MSGLYIHIPFCKQACYYCDFHFSTSLKKKGELVTAICTELFLRKHEIKDKVETIYFGGGTPSLLSPAELSQIFEAIYQNYSVTAQAEITLEANPDDLSKESLEKLSQTPINRLSIGVQSFFEEDLRLMNRAHNANEALASITVAKAFFENLSIDLIYGIPRMSSERWLKNLEQAFSLNIPHLSCYALTVEPKTALENFIKKGVVAPIDEEVAQAHYELLLAKTERNGYENYEFSNFGKAGHYSQNNMAYWQGKSYVGVGPSAHSYDGSSRRWNINNNTKYIEAIQDGNLPFQKEELTLIDRYNEYIMTGLRTKWGVSLMEIEKNFGKEYASYLRQRIQKHLDTEVIMLEQEVIHLTKKGKFLGDGIASDLFLVNLKT